MANNDEHNAQYWVEQLGKVQLPVLSNVMKDLNAVTQSDIGCATKLSDIILRDAALTTKILRVANSAYHNPNSENTITTISRAVVQLGFQGIKAISLSVMLVDSLFKKESKTRMLEWMARGFHSAVQAENLINLAAKDDENEQVFITALLLHIGDMAFWSNRGEYVKMLDEKLEPASGNNTEIENELLGCSIKDISIGLVNEWQLGDELLKALCPSSKPDKATQAVLLGEQISLAAEKGWDSKEFADVLVDASLFTGAGLEKTRKMLIQGADKAASVAVDYGAAQLCSYLPGAKTPNNRVENTSSPNETNPERVLDMMSVEEELSADPKLQLDMLREMGTVIERNIDINTLFTIVVKGIHKGIGLERVSLCLIDPKAGSMKAKYVLGNDTDEWRDEMNFPVKSEQDNLFAHCLHGKYIVWLRRQKNHTLQHLVNKKMVRLIDTQNCLISSVYVGNRPIGIIVADRGKSGRDISTDQQESFEHFTQQATLSLSMLASKAAK